MKAANPAGRTKISQSNPRKIAKVQATEVDGHMGWCSWSSKKGYSARTKDGEIPMFDEGGHRAVEVMLMATAACLSFFMVAYVRQRKLKVTDIHVSCDGEIAMRPERIKQITTRVVVEGDLPNEDIRKMVRVCEGSCKVMNTLKNKPECNVVLMTPAGEVL